MVQKSALVVNDNQFNAISKLVLCAAEQLKKVYFMPVPPLIPDGSTRDVCSERVAGFYGAIDQQVDIDLISQAAMALPSWVFELILTKGEVSEALQSLPNVLVKKASDDTSFFSRWSVALLPYSCDEHQSCSHPSMLIDYIRHGLPVAATALPALHCYSAYITEQRPKEPFANTLRQAYVNASRAKSGNHIPFNEWWEKISNQLVNEVKLRL